MTPGAEPDIKNFLAKILNVVTALVSWAVVNMFFGLYLDWAIVNEGGFNILNAMFYIFFISSLVALIYYFYKVWKR